MYKRLSIFTLLAALLTLLSPNLVQAGTPTTILVSAPAGSSINAGGTVEFSINANCFSATWTVEVQLIDDTTKNPLTSLGGAPITLTNTSSTGFITLTFPDAGTYNVGLDVITGTPVCGFEDNGVITGAPIEVTVAAAATTTVAPTTTIAPTTSVAPTTTEEPVAEVLPLTGADNTGALVALGIALTGAVVLISRRRLLTQ